MNGIGFKIILRKSGFSTRMLAGELCKYAGASIIGTTLHYGLMTILIRVFNGPVLLSSTAGAISGAITIYCLNYFFTFHSPKKHLESMSKFFLVASMGVFINGAVLKAAMRYFQWQVMMAQLFATAVVFCINFSINRRWTF